VDALSRRSIERALGPRRAELLAEAGRLGAGRGWPVYLVGGVVRDLLLGRSTKDLDLVVVGNARSLARDLTRRHHATYREHRAFGTAAVVFDDGLFVDLATSRRDIYAHPAALPRIEPSDLHADLRRRDFTINCIALNLAPRRFGVLVDPLDGRADLRDRKLRVLHERSFIDDPTRALRAIRFAARLGFAVEPFTAGLIRLAARDDLFSALSSARLGHRSRAATVRGGDREPPTTRRVGGMVRRSGRRREGEAVGFGAELADSSLERERAGRLG
jgi:tRNA nucleotidyltransferase (CCA-adding enzyme)